MILWSFFFWIPPLAKQIVEQEAHALRLQRHRRDAPRSRALAPLVRSRNCVKLAPADPHTFDSPVTRRPRVLKYFMLYTIFTLQVKK